MAIPTERCYECGCTAAQNPAKPFCTECGHRREAHALVCGQCHQLLGESTAFCEHCGAPIERPVDPAVAPEPIAAQAAPVASEQPATTEAGPGAAVGGSEDAAEPPAHPCMLCHCQEFSLKPSGVICARCRHPAAEHGLTNQDVASMRRTTGPASRPGTRPPGSPRPLSVAPRGLLAAAWVAGLFAALSIVVGIAAYADSSSTTTDTFGDSVQSAADTATLIAAIGIAAFWLMICCFCAGLHGHLDRIARATLERD